MSDRCRLPRETPRVYVRHRGRATAAQARALATLASGYVVDAPGTDLSDRLAAAFGRRAPLAVEVGFGNGHALAAFARTRPDWNCLGVDVYQPGFGALMLACEREQLGNVRIVAAEGSDLLARLDGGSVCRLHVYFPDPWPKKRHHKRRLVDAAFAARAAACLAAGGILRLATDWPHYAEQMRAVLDAEPALAGGPAARPGHRPQTPFEAKAVAQGRRVFEFRYRRA